MTAPDGSANASALRAAPGAAAPAVPSPALDFARDLRAGLRVQPRSVSPKWFYDARGSALFDRICELPEYYPTRTELALLRRHAHDIARHIGPGCEVVEFGAGSSVKVRILLQALRSPAGFVPIDISGEHLQQAARGLQQAHPTLPVHPVVADFTGPLHLPPARGLRVGFWPGSSIGNFEPEVAAPLLRHMAKTIGGGPLLVGVDLVKEPARLHAAYNDAAGVTAAFNLNLLERARSELGAVLQPQGFAHYAFWNPAQQRIEMHLHSRGEQTIELLGEPFVFADGQTLHTENSYKYTPKRLAALAAAAGLAVRHWWTDTAGDMALAWLDAG